MAKLQSISIMDMQNRPIIYSVFSDPWDATGEAQFRLAVMDDDNLAGIVALQYSKSNHAKTFFSTHENWQQDDAKLKPLIQKIISYLKGTPTQWDETILIQSTDFTTRIWQLLAQVQYGDTISYSDLAERSGNANAVRAVATACANNPIPLIIPCHRIIAKDGTLGGFAWGLPWKQKLLAMEATQSTAHKDAS